jgi:hypothetical protein
LLGLCNAGQWSLPQLGAPEDKACYPTGAGPLSVPSFIMPG